MTYLLLDLVFLGAVAVVALATFRAHRDPVWRAIGFTAIPLIVLTAVFDNVLVGTRIVAYDPALISGIRIGYAPVEDFSYAIAAVVLLPCLWALLAPRTPSSSGDAG